ncbi:single-stranded-DNA-specific exonuclease RecJ [Alkalibacterium olivapovliticus]|uniref:Single-stranded-DNA-specific exonuclease RecJ n=1 Tax=Alkalibacterium olivapovliticus TaxID=99907 RepID=A0A2T0WBM2_9LACT|nr:single-stranded-DNA-specific exonuclease RecJ [Alkalibacterium olivapovliticus]PRY84103.1 single-stranded-DNA-specific exonuclease [Alkalibacterium olivapovliticus]
MLSETIWRDTVNGDEETINQLADELNHSRSFIRLCMNRGLISKEEISRFKEPSIDWFHDPFEMVDMTKTVERIQAAIMNNQKITVYGDYDADGVTSTVIMYEAIELLGGQVNYFIPNRFIEGYGPNVEAFEQLIENGTELIITVDNGIAGHEAISRANELGVDVIVTDHHECPKELPKAYSIIHPKHPAGTYPFKELAGAGVSLKVAQALMGEIPEEFLELAMIGTIADVVSLTDENRAIAYFGLKLIKRTQRLGLLTLLSKAEITLSEIDEEVIGFKLAPPINAVGRLGDASDVVELLNTFDDERAKILSQMVLDKNTERKQIVEKITKEAFQQLNDHKDDAVIVLKDADWHQGVLGIVASKVVEKTNKPTLILSLDQAESKLKGSGRSIEGFNLFACMEKVSHHLTGFGGHEMACGLSLDLDKLGIFNEELNAIAQTMTGDSTLKRELIIDSTADFDELSIEMIEELNQLRPFGQDNKKPLFKLPAVVPQDPKVIGANKDHFKTTLSKDDKMIDLIAFGASHWQEVFKSHPTLDVAGYIAINEWNGNRKLQVQAIDYRTDQSIVIDKRQMKLNKAVFKDPQAHYIFFQKSVYSKWNDEINSEATHRLMAKGEELTPISPDKKVYIVDIPDDMADFKSVYSYYETHSFFFYFYSPNDYYFKGMPKHSQFSTLYKWLHHKKEIKLETDTNELIRELKVDKEVAKFMLMVFLENEFVTMEDGKLSVVSNPSKKRLEDTKTYKRRLNQIKVEEKLVYSSFNELLTNLKES